MEQTFDSLMTRYEMGQAYVRITQTMGPSPQLVAFVNYDKITSDSLGLESFNIMDQHQQILIDIENDPSLEMAMESIKSLLKAGAGGYLLGRGATAAVLSLTFLGSLPIVPILIAGAGAILIKSALNDVEAPTVKYFTDLTAKFNEAVEQLNKFSSIPSNLDEKAWSSFNEKMSDVFDSSVKKDLSSFKESGWNADKAKNAINWLKSNVETLKTVDKKIGSKFASLESKMSSDKSSATASKQVSVALKSYQSTAKEAADILYDIEKVVAKVVTHFESKDKSKSATDGKSE